MWKALNVRARKRRSHQCCPAGAFQPCSGRNGFMAFVKVLLRGPFHSAVQLCWAILQSPNPSISPAVLQHKRLWEHFSLADFSSVKWAEVFVWAVAMSTLCERAEGAWGGGTELSPEFRHLPVCTTVTCSTSAFISALGKFNHLP